MNVELGLLEAFPRQHAFAFMMDLEHVFLGPPAFPTENFLEDMGDVVHEVDGIIPANDEEARLKAGLRIGLVGVFNLWKNNGGSLGRHAVKIKFNGATVYGVFLKFN